MTEKLVAAPPLTGAAKLNRNTANSDHLQCSMSAHSSVNWNGPET